jgi:hypothetical protein
VNIARRLEIRGPDSRSWIVLLPPVSGGASALRGLVADLSALLQREVRLFDLRNTTSEHIVEAFHQPKDDIAVLFANVSPEPELWSSLDLMRSALERKGPVIFWLPADCVAGLSEHAPNIRSFIGGSVYVVSGDGGLMTQEERDKRLGELTKRYGLTNEQIVQRAESKTLSSEPHFIEWLVLLGRGDLV